MFLHLNLWAGAWVFSILYFLSNSMLHTLSIKIHFIHKEPKKKKNPSCSFTGCVPFESHADFSCTSHDAEMDVIAALKSSTAFILSKTF